CLPCHGALGRGDGLVSLRASRLPPATGTVWVPPIDVHDPRIVAMPEGEIFNTITHGIRNMRGYGDKLTAEDRWAVIAYVRALQASRRATLDDLPLAERERLNALPEGGR
ncbi:MAG TPA: cytochrome c, partial [Planctomycetota bacterium]|nr:cytochrome c [Planctomycetota bacterium]